MKRLQAARRYLRLRVQRLETRCLLTSVSTTLLSEFAQDETPTVFSEFSGGDGLLYFDVDNTEVWRTDGTAKGTLKLADANRTSDKSFDVLGLKLFNVWNGARTTIWRTDGTPEGTFELLGGRQFDSILETVMLEAKERFFFTIHQDSGWELYRSDGTIAGTKIVHSAIETDPVATRHGVFYIAGNTLFRVPSDGDVAQTVVELEAPIPFRPPIRLHAVNERVVLFVNGKAWSGDGLTSDLVHLHPDLPNMLPEQPGYYRVDGGGQVVNDVLVYPLQSLPNAHSLYRTNGTVEGTYQLDMSKPCLQDAGVFNGIAYFHGCDFDTGQYVVTTDGSEMIGKAFGFYSQFELREDGVGILSHGDSLRSVTVLGLDGESVLTVSAAARVGVANVSDTWYYSASPFVGDTRFGRIHGATGVDTEIPPFGQSLGWNNSIVAEGSRNNKSYDASLFVFSSEATLSVLDGGTEPEFVAQVSDLNFHHYADDGFYFTSSTDAHEKFWVSDGSAEGTVPIELGTKNTNPKLILWNGQTIAVADAPTGSGIWFVESAPAQEVVLGDANGDSLVNFADFLVLSLNYGQSNADHSQGDFDDDGLVSFADFLILANQFA